MELQTIQTTTTWNDAAGRINDNNSKINASITKLENASYKNKGYFKTLAALNAAFPYAGAGCKAYVGPSYPYSVYIWDTQEGNWIDSGEKGSAEVTFFEFEVDPNTMEVIMRYELWGGGTDIFDFNIDENGYLIVTI
jgi:hypothetical protein